MELAGEAQEVVALSREECSRRCVSPGAAQPSALVRAKRQPCSFPHNRTQGRTLCKSSPQLSEWHAHRRGCSKKGK